MSKARNSARGKHCALRLEGCNYDEGTTVLAHIRRFGWAGAAQKPPDFLGVYACSNCHDKLDRRSKGQVSDEDILRALGETQIQMHREGVLQVK